MAEFHKFEEVVKQPSHHLTPLIEQLIDNPALAIFLDKIVKLAEDLPLRSFVSMLAKDIPGLVDKLRDQGDEAYEDAFNFIEKCRNQLETTSTFSPHFSTKLDLAELYPEPSSISDGPSYSGVSTQEVVSFRSEHSDLGICSYDVLQYNSQLTDWTLDEVHVFKNTPDDDDTCEPAPPLSCGLVKPPVSCVMGSHTYGVSFKQESVLFKAVDEVVGGRRKCGDVFVNVSMDEQRKLKSRVRRRGHFTPLHPEFPLRVTKKIDGQFCFMKRGAHNSYLQFRSGDYAILNNGFNVKLGLEYVPHQGFYLLYIDRWKFDNPIGFNFVDELLEKKEISINFRGINYPVLDTRYGNPPHDGIVAHYGPGTRQYFFKDSSTIDVDHSTAETLTRVHGLEFVDPVPLKGVYEYVVDRQTCYLVRERDTSANSLRKIEDILSTQTAENFLDTFPDVPSFLK